MVLSTKEHVTAVEDVLQTLLAKGLKLKISKCKIGKTSIETLGFRASYHAIQPSDEHVQQLAAFPTPCCGQSLLQFLDFVSFFGRWIERCADRTAPLHEVFRDTSWSRKKSKRAPVRVPDFEARRTQRQQNGFEEVRAAIADPMILVPPRAGARKRVVSGASNIGGGLDANKKEGSGLEGQSKGSGTEEQGEWRPVDFIARKLNGGEPRYTTMEKEAGEKKVVVIGDVKSRFVLAVPCKDGHAETLSKNLWERWFAVFGLP
jgi:hypothetical protein